MYQTILATSLAWGLFFGGDQAAPTPKTPYRHHVHTSQPGRIDAKALHALIHADVDMFIADARPSKYDNGKRIPGARALPYNTSDSQISQAIPNKKTLIVTYCGSSRCPLSGKLARRLKSLGYQNVVENSDGLKGWDEAGFPLR